MPRKVTDAIVNAFLSGRTAKQANTSTDGNSFYLHGNEIAKIENGELWITNAGWASRTTYERLNGLPGVSVNVKGGRSFLNGVPWDGNWISVGKVSTLEGRIPNKSRIKAEIRNVLKTIIKEEVARAVRRKKVIKEAIAVDKSNPKNIETGVSNIFLKGAGYDTNGNLRIIAGLPNDRGISVQVGGSLPETESIISRNGGRYVKLHKLTDQEIQTIGREVTEYIQKYGSGNTKKNLKVYGNNKNESRLREASTTVEPSALRQYIATALWSTADGEDGNLDDQYTMSDLAPQSLKVAKKDLEDFTADVEKAGLLDKYLEEFDMTNLAHDFWLTRNHHGAGFWDRSYSNDEDGDLGDKLTEIAEKYKEQDWYAGDDGKIYISGKER